MESEVELDELSEDESNAGIEDEYGTHDEANDKTPQPRSSIFQADLLTNSEDEHDELSEDESNAGIGDEHGTHDEANDKTSQEEV